jgi:DNA-binding CsgD family transcriptional regulator
MCSGDPSSSSFRDSGVTLVDVSVEVTERQLGEIIRRCYLGHSASELREDVLRRLRSIVPVDAAFFATVDPATLLFTSAMAEEPLGSVTPLFLDNEYGQSDVNKFTTLADRTDPVGSLDGATKGDRHSSLRYLDVIAPLGLGDELRAALIARGRCGGVLCLHRGASCFGFSEREIAIVRRLAPHFAEGLRRSMVIDGTSRPPDAAGPGIVVLDDNLSLLSMNPEAEGWIDEMRESTRSPGAELPMALYAAAAHLKGVEAAPEGQPTSVRLQTNAGRWLILHASHLYGSAGRQTAIVLEPASSDEMSSLILDAHGLTPAQNRVAELVLRGFSTQAIVNELHISAHTVQEHLSVIFDKFGVGSRRELVNSLLGGPR